MAAKENKQLTQAEVFPVVVLGEGNSVPGRKRGEAKGCRQMKRGGVMRGDAETSCNEIRAVYMRGFC